MAAVREGTFAAIAGQEKLAVATETAEVGTFADSFQHSESYLVKVEPLANLSLDQFLPSKNWLAGSDFVQGPVQEVVFENCFPYLKCY